MSFELKAEHLKLLKHAYVEWVNCESGAPAINCKRPYGNGNVPGDVAEILGIKKHTCPSCGEEVDEEAREAAVKLHRETEQALAIVLARCGEETLPGIYVRSRRVGGPAVWERQP